MFQKTDCICVNAFVERYPSQKYTNCITKDCVLYALELSGYMCTLEVICDYQKTRKRYTEMLKAKFGIEIEFTGITRTKAAEIMAKHFESPPGAFTKK